MPAAPDTPARRTGRRFGPGRYALIVVILLQMCALYVPMPPGGGSSQGLDKVVHFVIFAVPVLVSAIGGRSHWPCVIVMTVHAPVSEIVQAVFLPTRSGDPADVVADLLGIGAGCLLAPLIARRTASSNRRADQGALVD